MNENTIGYRSTSVAFGNGSPGGEPTTDAGSVGEATVYGQAGEHAARPAARVEVSDRV